MKIAVTGSTGLIGSSLCNRLLEVGHEVVPVRRLSSAGGGEDSKEDEILWNTDSGLVDPQVMNGFDALIHLAGKSIASGRWTESLKNEIRDSRVQATHQLAGQLAQLSSPPQTVISASATGIYGDCGDRLVDETSPPGEGFLAEVAQGWEASCDPLREIGIRVVHPRFGMVLTRQGGALGKVLPLFRSMVGGRVGSGRQYWSWISLEDCVEALLWLLQRPNLSGAFNLVTPEPVTNLEFTEKLASVLSKPAALPAPALALRLALGEMADALLLTSCRAAPRRLLESGYEFQFPELRQFLEHELNQNSH